MYKYDGLMVHQSHDDEGVIEIIDKEGVRALHFGSHSRQSTMLLEDPNQLHSLYARAMMALLLFHDSPRDILMIGLGGGTLTKYLLHQFVDCKIKVVEFRRGVLKVARSHFGLPLDPRLKVKIGCGAEYVDRQSHQQADQHDLIMIDAFDHEGMAPQVSSETFFEDCRTLLQEDGLLAINLWGTNKDQFQEVAWNMGRVFDWRILFLPVRKRGNVIGFAFGADMAKPSMKELQLKALRLEQQYQLEFPTFVQDFKRNNNKVLNRVIRK
ncbi:spermine synthase [Methylomarinum sp. Ch1-1]|uniref:Spermine synthase n=1 Tax=Methylomarinum roseum TaxID=3067653 RepID=A0AAU7NZR5_9GAMM|nr:spermine synthase [Methylomarinum sp. Ch1-1]MDP4521414.1 spermine synthase [Methylomarinum sp. Ch1-1]